MHTLCSPFDIVWRKTSHSLSFLVENDAHLSRCTLNRAPDLCTLKTPFRVAAVVWVVACSPQLPQCCVCVSPIMPTIASMLCVCIVHAHYCLSCCRETLPMCSWDTCVTHLNLRRRIQSRACRWRHRPSCPDFPNRTTSCGAMCAVPYIAGYMLWLFLRWTCVVWSICAAPYIV